MNVYEIVTEKILAQLEAGTIPWKQPWRNDGTVPSNFVSKKPYRGMNLFLLPRSYPTNYYLTYKQCDEMGYSVKKGEKGYMVIFWKFFDRPQADGDGTAADEIEKDRPPMLRYYVVFNVAQTTIPEEKIPQRPAVPGFSPLEECASVVDHMPNAPKIEHGEARA
jgi:antirestriction protein ArdC